MTSFELTAPRVEEALRKHGAAEKAKNSARFFKTGEGQYGYGDMFIGVTVPEQRKIAKQYKDLSLPELKKLLASKFHECRLTALLILVAQFKAGEERTRENIVKFYLANTKRVNNWDLVDSSAPYILGKYLFDKDRSVLYKLAKSKNLWERRIAILSTFWFIREGDFKDALAMGEMLLSDAHDLMHKATGWMLREVGKRSKPTLVRFLNTHKANMPRTTLRYAIERFSKKERDSFMAPDVINYSLLNRQTYEDLAQEYEDRAETLLPITQEAMRYFGKYIKPNGTVLDVGCAVGIAVNVLRKMNFQADGIEISPKMAAFARSRNPKAKIFVGDFLKTNLTHKYDAILAFAFIHLFPKKEAKKLIEKMRVVLGAGGVVLLSSTESEVIKEGWEIKQDFKLQRKRFRKSWTEQEMREFIQNSGFTTLALKKFKDPFGKVWMDFVARKI